MGRFYKTANPEFLDFMYELPKELMIEGIKNTDKGINDTLSSVDEKRKLLEVEAMKEDSKYTNDQLKKYEDELDGISNTILGDVMQYKKQAVNIRGLTRKIETDIKRGGLSKVAEHLKQWKEYEKKLDADNTISAERRKLLKDASRASFGGTNYIDEDNYNELEPNLIAQTERVIDNDLMNKLGDGFEAERTAYATTNSDGVTVVNASGTSEFKDLKKLDSYARANLVSSGWDADRRQELELKKKLGQLEGEQDIDKRMKVLEEEFVSAFKDKFGAVRKTANRSLSGDPSDRGDGGNSTGGQEVELKDNTGSPAKKRAAVAGGIEINGLIQNGSLAGFNSANHLAQSIQNGSVTFSAAFNAVQKAQPGMTRAKFRETVNSLNDLITPYIKVKDKNVLNSFNTKDSNVPVKKIVMRDSDNNRIDVGTNVPGKVLENAEYFLVPITGTSTGTPVPKTDANGNLVDKNNKLLKNATTGNYYSKAEIDKAVQDGYEPVYDKASQVSSYESSEQMFTTKGGPLQSVTVKKLNDNNTITEETTLRHTTRYYKVSKSDPSKYENVTLELIMDPKSLGNKE